MEILGRESIGDGPKKVLVLHDWMGDHRNYDPVLPYLDRTAFTYALADLRGYGLSRDLHGRYDLREAAGDVLALATHLGWSTFHLVGHSMSTLVVQQVAASAPERVTSLALLTPVLPSGMGTPEDVIGYLEKMATDEATRREAFVARAIDRLSLGWVDFKLRRWWESARPEASRAYVRMFSSTAITGSPRADVPVLAVVGAHDSEWFQEKAVRDGMSKHYSRLEVAVCASSGHYPMQETPVALASLLERFLERV